MRISVRRVAFLLTTFIAACAQPNVFLGSDDFPYIIPESLKRRPWEISVTSSHAVPFPKNLYGFNAQLLGVPYTYDDPTFEKTVKELDLKNLRFPGGTVANFYQWRTDDFGNIHSDAPEWIKQRVPKFRGLKEKYGYDSYAALVKKYDITPIIVLNILHQSPNDAVEWIGKMKKDGLDVKYVELGNEVMFQGQNTPETKDVKGYIKITRAFARAVKKAFPDVRVGVCAAPYYTAWEKWNKPLGKENYYDAVIYHSYLSLWESRDRPFVPSMLKKALSAEELVDGIRSGTKVYFGKKPVWLTEWNIGGESREWVGSSGVLPLFAAGVYLRLLEHPEVFELSCFHQLIGFLVRIRPDGGVGKLVVYPAWVLVGKAVAGCDAMLKTRVEPESVKRWAFPPLAARAFRSKDRIQILILNRTPLEKEIKIKVDGRERLSGEIFTFSTDSLTRDLEIPARGSGIVGRQFEEGCRIPPYSISVVVLKSASRWGRERRWD